MVRNINKYIFIYIISIIFIGCDVENVISPSGFCDYCYIELDAPSLEMDENGVYQLDFQDNNIQTFTRLRVFIGYELEYLNWTTDVMFDGCTWNYCEDVPIVNSFSYSDSDGYAYQMMGVYQENIGQIATIWVGYYDNYGTQWLDSIKVKINE